MFAEPVGMLATAVYVPAGRMDAAEIARRTGGRWSLAAVRDKLGIEQKAVAGPEEGAQEMGARAAEMCMQKAGIGPLDVDAILCIGDELREYPMTTSGSYIQWRIGARRAWAVDVMQKCSSFAAGVCLARALLHTHAELRTLLVCGGYRNGDLIDYTNPRVSFMYNLAAGGGAVLLRRGHAENVILGTAMRTDGSLARHVLARYGGTAAPITAENAADAAACLDVVDPDGMRARLEAVSHENFLGVVHDALRAGGAAGEPIDYLAILHMKRSAHDRILADLGLRPEQSTYLSRYGHMGQFDQLLSLELALAEGRVRPGQLVVGVGAGIGYSWGAVALRWGHASARHAATVAARLSCNAPEAA